MGEPFERSIKTTHCVKNTRNPATRNWKHALAIRIHCYSPTKRLVAHAFASNILSLLQAKSMPNLQGSRISLENPTAKRLPSDFETAGVRGSMSAMTRIRLQKGSASLYPDIKIILQHSCNLPVAITLVPLQSILSEIRLLSLQRENLTCLSPYICKVKTFKTRMKTNSIFVAALLVLGVSASAFANKPGDKYGLAAIPLRDNTTYKVVYESEKAGKIKLNIYDQNRTRIFTHTIEGRGFIQPLNFKGLDAGVYTVEIVNGKSRETVTINHFPKVEPSAFVHISKLVNEDGKFLVSVAKGNDTEDESISLQIYQDDKLIYRERNTLADDFARIYAVKPSGKVTIAVTDKNGKTTSASF